MNESKLKKTLIWLFLGLFISAIFIVDLQFPTDVAVGIGYIAAVLVSYALADRRHTSIVATLCSALTILGYNFSPEGELSFRTIANPTLVLIVLWIIVMKRPIPSNDSQATGNQYHISVLEATPDAVLVIDKHGVVQYANQAVHAAFGWGAQEVVTMELHRLLAAPFNGEFKNYTENTEGLKTSHILNSRLEIQIRHKQDREYPSDLTITPLKIKQDEQFEEDPETGKKEEMYVCLFHLVTERKRTIEQLVWLSNHDELTRIFNRRYFNERLDLEWRRLMRDAVSLSVVSIDIDHFEKYNEALGEPAGDECLKTIVSVIPSCLKRASDIAARYAGEKFMLLLPHTDTHGAKKIANTIQQEINKLKIPHPNTPAGNYVTVSMGVATLVPSPSTSHDLLVKMSEKALQDAKQAGRNQIAIYQEN